MIIYNTVLIERPQFVCSSLACIVNSDYLDWGLYGECSKTCGAGVQTRKRTCTNPPLANGGKNCSGLGPDSNTRQCNNQECPGIYSSDWQWTKKNLNLKKIWSFETYNLVSYFFLLYGCVSLGLGTTEYKNLRIWFTEIVVYRFSHLDQHLDRLHFAIKKVQTKVKIYLLSSSEKFKGKWDDQTLASLSSAHPRSQPKCQLLQASYIERIKCCLFAI